MYLPIIIFFILVTGTISYLLASRQIEENAYNSISDTVTQTKNYLNNRLSDVFEQLVSLVEHPDMLSVLGKDAAQIAPDDYIRIDSHVNRIYSFYNQIVDSILVHLHSGAFVLSKSESSLTGTVAFQYDDYRARYHGSPFDYYWSTLHSDEIFSSAAAKNDVISVFRMIGDEDSRANGIIMFNLRRDFFEKVLNNELLGENGYLIIANQEGVVSFKEVSEPYRLNAEVVSHLQNLPWESGRFEFQKPHGKKMIVIYDTLGVNKWKVAAVFPADDILHNIQYIKLVTLSVIVVLILVALFLSNVLARYITKPISFLANHLKTVTNNQPVWKPDRNVPSEVGILYNGIADLMQRVNVLLEQEVKRQLELSVMRAQINPHFLYNTLYSIKGLCEMGRNQEASAMVTALSTFFRISISKGKEIISVQEEIDHISNYLFIQEMRYGDEFSYHIEVEPHLSSCTILKLTLQPLIENAIYHGVKMSHGKGQIWVKGYQEGEHLVFAIQDNGTGIPGEKLEQINRALQEKDHQGGTIGFGLRSVHERLRIHYGWPYGLTMESEWEKGTVAKVTIPMRTGG